MIINNVVFNVELLDVLNELQGQLHTNNIPLLRKIKDVGDDVMVSCPYHNEGQEKRPSAGIRKSDGTFHCFACGETHSLPEVISYCFGYDDMLGKEGWKWLLKNFAVTQVNNRDDIFIDYDRKNALNSDFKRSTSIGEDELDSYRYIHSYMYKRGLTDDVIELFDIGYDKVTDCITFPIRDTNGNCLGIARRSTHGKYFNYPQGFEKPLYGLYELYTLDKFPKEVIVCESMLDALSFWTVNKYAVALNGLGNQKQFEQLKQLPCRALILCTDMDEAGLSARKKIRQNIGTSKIIYEYFLPENRKDANECTKEELLQLKVVL